MTVAFEKLLAHKIEYSFIDLPLHPGCRERLKSVAAGIASIQEGTGTHGNRPGGGFRPGAIRVIGFVS